MFGNLCCDDIRLDIYQQYDFWKKQVKRDYSIAVLSLSNHKLDLTVTLGTYELEFRLKYKYYFHFHGDLSLRQFPPFEDFLT